MNRLSLSERLQMTYDVSVDVLRIVFSDRPIGESCADKSGVILDASKHVSSPTRLEYSVVGVKSPYPVTRWPRQEGRSILTASGRNGQARQCTSNGYSCWR